MNALPPALTVLEVTHCGNVVVQMQESGVDMHDPLLETSVSEKRDAGLPSQVARETDRAELDGIKPPA